MTSLTLRPHRMSRVMDHWFDAFLNQPTQACETEDSFVPRVNVASDNDNISLTFELPGIDRSDIKVLVKDDILTVSGERSFATDEKDEGFVRSEILSGSFSRSFTLPENLVTEKVSADYKNGMLVVTLPRAEEVKPKEIEINVA